MNTEYEYEPDIATVEQWIKFGGTFWYFKGQPDLDAYTEGVQEWIKASVASKSPNAVFMDTTTMQTALSLLRGGSEILTPMTLLDLANVRQRQHLPPSKLADGLHPIQRAPR
jgi:hypothetical protein